MIDGKSFNTEAFKEESLDQEIEELVYLINQVDGVETTDSCFGHHKMPCQIVLRIKNADIANKFIRRFFYFDPLWSLKLTFSEANYFDELLFVIESAYQNYPTINLMVENLTKRFEDRVNAVEIEDKCKADMREPKREKICRCNTCKNYEDDEISGECYECMKGIFDHYESENEDKE